MNPNVASLLLFCATFLVAPSTASAVTMAWSPVGNPGNAGDTTLMIPDGTSGYGAVAYNYNIGTYDVTAGQYAEFLNAKDANGLNTLGLYNNDMSNVDRGGINFTGGNLPGSKYSVIAGREDHPANYINWFNTLRFANWLNNGQGNSDTESGAYTLLGGTTTPSNANSITRNPGARIFLPSENEWYKAAYYNPNTSLYFKFPTSSDAPPTPTIPTALPNSVNYGSAVQNLTDVGAYSGTTSPYGAYDMAGNVWQWNEALFNSSDPSSIRGLRGGSFGRLLQDMLSSTRLTGVARSGGSNVGFRLASVPEPSSFVLAALGLIGLVVWKRRKR